MLFACLKAFLSLVSLLLHRAASPFRLLCARLLSSSRQNFDCRNALPSHQNSSGGGANGLFSMNTTGMASPGPFISLAFQQNMSIASLPQPTPPDSPAPPMAPFAQRSISCDSSFSAPPSVWLHNLTEKESAFYRTNKHVKPPFSYADLICMAMRDLRKSKITLSDIYSWIQDNFVFYQNADQSWQVSFSLLKLRVHVLLFFNRFPLCYKNQSETKLGF